MAAGNCICKDFLAITALFAIVGFNVSQKAAALQITSPVPPRFSRQPKKRGIIALQYV